MSAVLEFDLVKDFADRTPFGEMAQFDHQVLLQRLVVGLGLSLQRSMDVVRDVTVQDVLSSAQTVELGHADVHEDHVVRLTASGCHRFQSVFDGGDLMAQLGKHQLGHLSV